MREWKKAAQVRSEERNRLNKDERPESASQARQWSIWYLEVAWVCCELAMAPHHNVEGPMAMARQAIRFSTQALTLD